MYIQLKVTGTRKSAYFAFLIKSYGFLKSWPDNLKELWIKNWPESIFYNILSRRGDAR